MWHIIKRKLWTQRKDLRIVWVMAGISLMMVFAFADFSGHYRPTVLVADQDQSQLSQKFFEKLQSDQNHVYEKIEQEKGLEAVKNNQALALLTIESGFETGVKTSREPAMSIISVKQDADLMVLKPLIINQYNELSSWHETSTTLAESAKAKGQDFKKVYEETYSRLQTVSATKDAITMSVGKDNSEAKKNEVLVNSMVGFLIFFVAYSSVFGAADLLTERRQNTWQRLLTSPSSKLGMISGQLVVSWVMGLMQLFVVLVGGTFLFKVDFGGSVVNLFVAGALFCLAMSGMGILISAFGKSMQQISALTSVILTAFGMLGGCLWPLELVKNPVLIGLSYITPHRYAVEALRGISRGQALTDVGAPLFMLFFMALIMLSLGFLKLLKTEERYQ